MIYTTNCIERLQKDFRRVTRMRGAMPNEESVLLLMDKTAMDKKSYLRQVPRIDNDTTLFPPEKQAPLPEYTTSGSFGRCRIGRIHYICKSRGSARPAPDTLNETLPRILGINRLFVHRLPHRTALHLLPEHEHTQSLHVLIRLAIRCRAIHRMDHTGSTTHGGLDHLLVRI